jgi:hypothetical protein
MARALAEGVDARFQSAGEMLAALRDLKGSKAPSVRRQDLPPAAALGRNRLLSILTLAGAALIGVVLLVVLAKALGKIP